MKFTVNRLNLNCDTAVHFQTFCCAPIISASGSSANFRSSNFTVGRRFRISGLANLSDSANAASNLGIAHRLDPLRATHKYKDAKKCFHFGRDFRLPNSNEKE